MKSHHYNWELQNEDASFRKTQDAAPEILEHTTMPKAKLKKGT